MNLNTPARLQAMIDRDWDINTTTDIVPFKDTYTFRNFDSRSNPVEITVVHDPSTDTYVAEIRGGEYVGMMDGSKRQAVVATGEHVLPNIAGLKALSEWNNRLDAMERGKARLIELQKTRLIELQ